MIIKKIIVGFFLLSFLNGCAQNTVLLGPAYTFGTTGSVYHAGLTFGSNKAISNFTGRSVGENIKEIFEPKDENAELKRLVKNRIEETRKKLYLTNQ